VALQRLARVRVDPALVVPLGLLFAAGAYWLSLVSAQPLVFPALVALALVPLAWRPSRIEPVPDGPSLRGAWPAIVALLAVLALAEYRANRVDRDGAFRLDVGEHVDTAVHVGVTWELVASYPPQVPGLAGVPMRYHVGSHLVRAAAARWAGIHPYDSISRFDVTLWGIALVLALRAAAHALGLSAAAVRLAGFVPLAADLSFVLGFVLHSPNAAMKLGGNFVEAVLFANSISPAMAAVLAAAVALARADRGEGAGYRVLAAGLGAGAGFLKAFTAAQLLLAFGIAWLARRSRLVLVPVGAVVALVVLVLALASAAPPGGQGVQVAFVPFAPTNPARIAFGLPEVGGLSLVLSGLAWLVLSLGLRAVGIPAALRALWRGDAAAASLGALALTGWPLALVLRITADPAYDESYYFLQASGLLLWLFALPALVAFSARSLLRAAIVLLLALPATAELVVRRALAQPERLPPPTVRAMEALRKASCPGDVVLTRPGVALVPPVVVLAGRRVPLAAFIPYWQQFTTPGRVAAREAQVLSFFRAADAASAVSVAHGLGASYVYFAGAAAEGAESRPRSVRQLLLEAGMLEPIHVEPRAAVYRIRPLAGAPGCRGVANSDRGGP